MNDQDYDLLLDLAADEQLDLAESQAAAHEDWPSQSDMGVL